MTYGMKGMAIAAIRTISSHNIQVHEKVRHHSVLLTFIPQVKDVNVPCKENEVRAIIQQYSCS